MTLTPNQINELRSIAGDDAVTVSESECDYFSQDVFSKGHLFAAIVRPNSQETVSKLVAFCYQEGIAMFPRGGGLSYTDGYLNKSDRVAISFDSTGLNRILEINEQDRFVRVEAGVTWAQLHQALAEKKLRTPFWGTLSGLEATVGGAVSQNSLFFGSAEYGISAESVLGIKAVTAKGEVLNTGSYAIKEQQAIRFFGPDLCGLLTGDCGALGVKTEVCLKLIQIPEFCEGYSYAFETAESLLSAMECVQRLNICSECFAFDPMLQRQRMKRTSLSDDVSQFGSVLKQSESLGDMLKKGSRIALAGRKFLDGVNYSMHCTVDAQSKAELEQKTELLDHEMAVFGKAIENTIPVVIRANPFRAANINGGS